MKSYIFIICLFALAIAMIIITALTQKVSEPTQASDPSPSPTVPFYPCDEGKCA